MKKNNASAVRKNADRHYEEIRGLNKGLLAPRGRGRKREVAREELGFGTGCDKCEQVGYCREILWTGAPLPCQSAEAEVIMNVRERDDFLGLFVRNQREGGGGR